MNAKEAVSAYDALATVGALPVNPPILATAVPAVGTLKVIVAVTVLFAVIEVGIITSLLALNTWNTGY